MIIQCYNRFKSKVHSVLENDWRRKLKNAERNVARHEMKIPRKQLRILFGPSFAIYPPSFVVDRALSLALRLKGIDVIPIYCDGVQDIECNCIGGFWRGKKNFSDNCKNCQKNSKQLWQRNLHSPIPLSQYLDSTDIKQIKKIVVDLDFDHILKFKKDGIAYGEMAKDILVNNYLVATPTLIKKHEYLIKAHLQNLLVVSLAYERILDKQQPDRVVANDSYYGMWAILEQHCKSREIPFYSHWPVTKNRVAFAYNDAAMNLNFTKSWPQFSKIPLTIDDEERIEKWLSGERGYVIDATKLAGHECVDPILATIYSKKPTLLLAANVIWDLAALNKQVVFKDMVEWIIETIEWFRDNKNFQLIIRPHPVETSPQIPRTRETVATAIELTGIELPKNVFLLKSDASVTFNELITTFDVRGVAVHTSTIGFECPARGIPVVTTAKSPYRGFGFTFDPYLKEEYFGVVGSLLTGSRKEVTSSHQELARKFIKFDQFHYYSNLGLFTGNPPDISKNFERILKDPDGSFRYVINSIIDGLPINDSIRWIPET